MTDVMVFVLRLRLASRIMWGAVVTCGLILTVLFTPASVDLYQQHHPLVLWVVCLVKAMVVMTIAELSHRIELRWRLRLMLLALLLQRDQRESDLALQKALRQLEWLRQWDVKHGCPYLRVTGEGSDRTYKLTRAGRLWARKWVKRFGGADPDDRPQEPWMKDPELKEWATADITVEEQRGRELLRPMTDDEEERQPWHATTTTSITLPTQRCTGTTGALQASTGL